MSAEYPFTRPLGAVAHDDGTVEFRVWAARARTVAVRVGSGAPRPLTPVGYGIHEARVAAGPGDDYLFVLDGGRGLPDPCSRWQPYGVRGPSRVIDPALFAARTAGWTGIADRPAPVIYELHIGTFSAAGTFAGAIPYLAELRDLGIDAIELMPVATVPGRRNWGYDGVYLGAPHQPYGGPAGLVRLVTAAHAAGLGVILDVVYNHVGPGAQALSAFGPYFSGRYGTPWGDAINYDDAECEPVRQWAIQNAVGWIRDYRVDGLRLDAIHAIYDSGPRPIVAEICASARAAASWRPLLIAESGLNDPSVLAPAEHGGLGVDAQWSDDFHHALHTTLTDERDGYYVDFDGLADLASALRRPFVYDGRWSPFRRRRAGAPADGIDPERFIVCSQNHDQVGNRALGDRPRGRAALIGAFWTLLSPYAAMLFMGEEYGEERPFLFFTDHIDPEIAEATRRGRRAEFAEFAAFSHQEVPDPQSPATHAASVLDRSAADPAIRELFRDLIRLRRELAGEPVRDVVADLAAGTLRARRGPVTLVANFAAEPRAMAVGSGTPRLSCGGAVSRAGERLRVDPLTAAALA